MTDQLRAWGVAHAQARRAEEAALQNEHGDAAAALRRQARALREHADRLHREVYRNLDARSADRPR